MCKICECGDNEVPEIWKQKGHSGEEINLHIEDPFNKWTEKFSISTKQWLLPSDIDSPEGSFVDLLKNPEGYTGYRGPHIWDAIFRENCFSDKIHDLCREDRTFYRIFSGWLSNTNMQIGINYHNRETNETYLNVSMLTSRLLNNKERIDNLFFLYSLMIKAAVKGKNIILNYNYQSGNTTEDNKTLSLLKQLFENHEKELLYLNDAFNETNSEFENFMHSGKINELIIRFRNISEIIDCVTCSKCRMHAKLEVFGISTMLKIMFSSEEDLKTSLIRNELVSFMNVFAKLSKTISYIKLIDDRIKTAHKKLMLKYIGLGLVLAVVLIFMNFKVFRRNPKKIKSQKEKSE